MIEENCYKKEVVFNYCVKLHAAEMQELSKYCNALDFEPYRDREMSMRDPGCCGYRDEASVEFIGITDSYIPKMQWMMSYYYDEAHIWPSEKLYRYILTKHLTSKKTRGWISEYGAFSLPIWNK